MHAALQPPFCLQVTKHWFLCESGVSHWLLTDVAEQHRQEDEAVRGSQQHNGQVHPEVEDLEDLGLGKGQHNDTPELRQRDPTENLRRYKRKKVFRQREPL